MPAPKKIAKPATPAKRTTPSRHNGAASTVVHLNVPVRSRVRSALNKLVATMDADNQAQVIEQLIIDELHRRNMRLPRE